MSDTLAQRFKTLQEGYCKRSLRTDLCGNYCPKILQSLHKVPETLEVKIRALYRPPLSADMCFFGELKQINQL